MAPKALVVSVGWLKDGVFRILPVASLIIYLILAIFSDSRRRKVKGFWRTCLWVAYELNDWAPAYVISNLYLETSPHDKMIVAFWVPFLLLHQARPDNITAYAMEDSELWIRNMFLVLLESLGSCFILYWYIIDDCSSGTLLQASCIMTFLGIFKYVESAVALRQCNLDIIGRSFKQQKISSSFDGDYSDEKALLVAHDLFEICKGAFCDYTVVRNRDAINSMFFGEWESLCKVVEMELSLMYDILYTKAAMVHTWHGYAIRLASPLLTATALMLFVLDCKEGMEQRDKAISYILLLMTFLFDVRWLLRALASAWTHSYFKDSWLKHEFLFLGTWKKLRGFVTSLLLSRLSLWLWTCECVKEPKSYRRWAGTFGQHNLLHKCIAGNRRGLELEDHSSGVEIPSYLKKLVFSNICEKLFPLPVRDKNLEPSNNNSPGSSSPRKPSTGKESAESSGGTATPSTSRPGCGKLLDYCTCLHPGSPDPDERCLDIPYELPGPAYPREQICSGIHDEPLPWLQHPRGWICTSVGIQATPCPQHPRQPICIGINNEPPRLPCPWQVCAGARNAPVEENRYNVPARPYGHLEEQAAEDHWRYDNEQAPPEAYEQAEHSWTHGLNRFACHKDTANIYLQDDGQAKADTDEQHGDQTKSMESDEDMGFPPELQEVILTWHIATDVFLSCSPKITGEESEKHEEAIKQMSDYMVFLVAERSEMLPGLKLRSLYENTKRTLKKIRNIMATSERGKRTSYVTNEKEDLAKWMPKNMDCLKDPDTNIIWEGTQLARVLLDLVMDGGEWRNKPDIEEDKQAVRTVERLAHWIPELLGDPHKSPWDMGDMLKFILDAWVRLLLYASIRCSRDSHAKQLSRGGELTTLVWIITEHAENAVVKNKLPLLFPPKKEKRQ